MYTHVHPTRIVVRCLQAHFIHLKEANFSGPVLTCSAAATSASIAATAAAASSCCCLATSSSWAAAMARSCSVSAVVVRLGPQVAASALSLVRLTRGAAASALSSPAQATTFVVKGAKTLQLVGWQVLTSLWDTIANTTAQDKPTRPALHCCLLLCPLIRRTCQSWRAAKASCIYTYSAPTTHLLLLPEWMLLVQLLPLVQAAPACAWTPAWCAAPPGPCHGSPPARASRRRGHQGCARLQWGPQRPPACAAPLLPGAPAIAGAAAAVLFSFLDKLHTAVLPQAITA